jgi:hypothetical protein
MAPCTLHRQSSQERETVAPREGAKVTPNVFRASGALTQVRGQFFLPAQPPRLRMDTSIEVYREKKDITLNQYRQRRNVS